MKKETVYRSDNGQLESDLDRAKAHDLAHAIDRAITGEAGPSSLKNSPRIDWYASMEIFRYADIVKKHLDEYIELRDENRVKVS